MSKIVLAAETTGVTKTNTSMFENVVAGATSIMKVASTEDANTAYYSEKAVGQAVLAGIVGGAVIGHKFGDRIPLFNKL